jgi:protocadherin Fat 4
MVGTLRASDPDTLGHLTYSLVSGDEGHFQLDSADTGVLRLKEALDREARDTYRLQVRASDGVQHTDTVVTIKVTAPGRLLHFASLALYNTTNSVALVR